jgi:heme-degrading monooxygenase HmoA
MFARIVECYAKVGMGDEAASMVREEVLPILRTQPGFVDLFALRDSRDRQRVVCITFWNTQESAFHYHREHYNSIARALDAILDTKLTLETLLVEVSTAHNVPASHAA